MQRYRMSIILQLLAAAVFGYFMGWIAGVTWISLLMVVAGSLGVAYLGYRYRKMFSLEK